MKPAEVKEQMRSNLKGKGRLQEMGTIETIPTCKKTKRNQNARLVAIQNGNKDAFTRKEHYTLILSFKVLKIYEQGSPNGPQIW